MAVTREPKFGVGLRRPHFGAVGTRPWAGVDFFEVLPENFMGFGGRPREVLRRARRDVPVVLHGVGLSIGGPDPLEASYLDALVALVDDVEPAWCSDHLSYASAFGVAYHDLLPLPFTQEAVAHVVERVQRVQERLRVPFALENPSYYFCPPGAEMDEATFISEVVRRSGCGLLLDVNNVYVNARNHGYDAAAFIDALPAECVVQLHIAGHDASGAFIVDTHGAPVVPPVYDLLAHTLRRTGPVWTLLEWDNDIPPLDALLAENARVRACGEAALGAERGAALARDADGARP